MDFWNGFRRGEFAHTPLAPFLVDSSTTAVITQLVDEHDGLALCSVSKRVFCDYYLDETPYMNHSTTMARDMKGVLFHQPVNSVLNMHRTHYVMR